MDDVIASLGWGLAVGGSLLAGALVAAAVPLPPRVATLLTSLGGGLLFAAVAFELVPEADARAGSWLVAAALLAGTLVYVAADRLLSQDAETHAMRRAAHAAAAGQPMPMPAGHAEAARGEAIAVGLVVDGVPESLALGLTVAEGEVGVALLAGVLVGNLVEAYGAAQPIIAGGHSRRFAATLLGAIGAALLVTTVLGGTVLAEIPSEAVGVAQALAAGAVVGVLCVAVVPHAFEQHVSRLAAVATVLGFACGYLLS